MTSSRRWACGKKPHIYYSKQIKKWICKLGIYSQAGATPLSAYYKRMALK